MYLQVTNSKLAKYNQIRTTPGKLIEDVKNLGWKISDCKVSEIRTELVEANYKCVDGKTSKRFSIK
jgi:nucleoside diphosphate kinase